MTPPAMKTKTHKKNRPGVYQEGDILATSRFWQETLFLVALLCRFRDPFIVGRLPFLLRRKT
jgi:hypothetical protein